MRVSGGDTRRAFLGRTALAAAGFGAIGAYEQPAKERTIQTVVGPIPAGSLGFALTHEHVMCDFIGAEKTGSSRWNRDDVVRKALPYLERLKKTSVAGFVDCTPAYIGRDVRVLKALAEKTGLHIVTNTGYYGGAKDKFVPKHAYEASADQLAAEWEKEWKDGIEGTGVKPGFMKIGVDEAKGEPPQVSEIDAKLVRAAAKTSLRTGMPVVCHTGGGPAGLAATKLFMAEGAPASKFIVAHSDGHGLHINHQVADLGAWVSFDAISRKPLDAHIKLVRSMLERDADRLLLSQDNGWYWVEKSDGGEFREYTYLPETFLPALKQAGVDEATVRKLTVTNPAWAFGT